MAQLDQFCTTQDVRNLSEYITRNVRSDAHIRAFIQRADAQIKGKLRGHYTIPTDFEESTPWNGPPQQPVNLEDNTINPGSADLSDITVSSSAVTEMWTLEFTSATEYTITGSASGSQGTGDVSSESSSTNSYITIPSANWSGTGANGDFYYISVYKHKPEIVALSAHLAASLALSAVYSGDDGTSEKAKEFMTIAKDILKGLQTPYSDEGMRLDSFSARDISPEGVGYHINQLGHDMSKYADNEATPWNDSAVGGYTNFIFGPVWYGW